jgi:hypothetical protein
MNRVDKKEKAHTNVTMYDRTDAEDPVNEGRRRAGGNEGGCGERDEASCEEALE